MTSVKQALCAGGFQEIVFGPNNEVLTLSTEKRFFTRAQRRAIAARDGGCTIPGCTIPAAWCEVHHVIPWHLGGKTNIDNGASCKYDLIPEVRHRRGDHSRIPLGP